MAWIVDLLDFRFRRYVTPWILGFTWGLVLLILALVILAHGINFVEALFLSDLASQRTDSGALFNIGEWGIPDFLWTIGRSIGKIVGAIACAIYLRVLMEGAVVFFNISISLAEIAKVAKDQKGP